MQRKYREHENAEPLFADVIFLVPCAYHAANIVSEHKKSLIHGE